MNTQLINELYNATEWILAVAGNSKEEKHIVDMVSAIDEAIEIIRNNNQKNN